MGRWRLRSGLAAVALARAIGEAHDLARQAIDLPPLRGDRLVQIVDGLILEHNARFECFETRVQVSLAHGLFRLDDPRIPIAAENRHGDIVAVATQADVGGRRAQS